MQKSATRHSNLTICPLYRIVFETRSIKTVVFVLLAIICVQPVGLAFANESTGAAVTLSVHDTEVAETAPTDQDSDTEETEIAEDEPPVTPEAVDEDVADVAEEALADSQPATSTAEHAEDDDTSIASTTENGLPNDETATSSSATSSTQVPDDETDTVDAVDEEAEHEDSDAQATSSNPSTVVATVATADNYHQFSRDECVRVADGSYYCGASELDARDTLAEDRFYVALDKDGDQEIFAEMDGEIIQITKNTVDDGAPYYDAVSNTLVWHQAVDERYQIMSYDFDTETIQALTSGRINNMEPTRFGDVTVWQQWGTQGWEIMLQTAEATLQLTDDAYPDIAPSIRGEYVLWKTVLDGSQVVRVYDLVTKEIVTINDTELGATVSNPRMVLVYDGVTEAGDIVTRGYDPETGEIVPLAAVPASMPEHIPDSEPVNETRALIQTKSSATSTREGGDDVDDDMPDVATTSPEQLDIPAETSSTTVIVPPLATSTEEVATGTIPDLVIPPVTASGTTPGTNATSTENGEELGDFDLVIPPATSTISQ